jgi:predicted MFS family arabinose efflux permease
MPRSGAARSSDPTPAPPRDSNAPTLTPAKVWLFTVMGALVVANLYYNQPLLAEIAASFGAPPGSTGYVSTLTQAGYALGLLLFVPLADVREHRSLVMALLVCVAAALAGVAMAPSLAWLAAASFVLGLTTVVPQIIVPFAAGLAEPEERGRVVGLVVGGLLIGILGARTVAGVLGAALGWRWVFGLAAGVMLVLASVAWLAFPRSVPAASLRYGQLLRSMSELLRTERVLGEVALTGACVFGAFSAFWTTLAFRLQTPPLHYGAQAAGLFGLVGIVGASVAPFTGRVTDKRDPRLTVAIGTGLVAAAYVLFLVAGHTIAGLVAGVILLDAGSQSVGVSNQARIYRLPAELHGRLNTVYMASFFTGGAAGSLLGSWAWTHWDWTGVCITGLVLLAGAGIVTLRGRRRLAAM